MKKLILLLSLSLVFLSPLVPVSAQDSQCDLTEFFTSLAELKPSGDQEKDFIMLLVLEAYIRALRANCAPHHLEGKGQVLTEIIALPAGIYRAEFKSTDSIVGHIEVITGECEMEYFSAIHGMTETSRIIRSEGCRAAFQFSAAFAPWTITIIPLD